MDGRDFDNLLRSLTNSRRTILGGSLAALGGFFGVASTEAKKKKKKCARKCADGCCTKKYGKCIQPAQQSSTQCGSGGEICRTNCGGVPTCGANCEGCCDGISCVELGGHDRNHCGHGGVACFPCDSNQTCLGAACCGNQGHTCSGGDTDCCSGLLCESGTCCAGNGSACTKDSDCCQAVDSVCENGQCRYDFGAPCQPGSLCRSPLTCSPQTLTCDGDTDCTTACAEFEHCEFLNCGGNLLCCDLGPCTAEERCNCLEGGVGCTALN